MCFGLVALGPGEFGWVFYICCGHSTSASHLSLHSVIYKDHLLYLIISVNSLQEMGEDDEVQIIEVSNEEKAEAKKGQGNKLYKSNDFSQAIKVYTESIGKFNYCLYDESSNILRDICSTCMCARVCIK